MSKYRVLDPNEEVIDTKEFANASDAYAWFDTVEVPSDKLGYRMEVQETDGKWHMFDQTDGTQSQA